ncbi:hypothetical protein VZT92_005501 [Zoarces viviparus]|uniref:Polyprotein n=1 Tax=Zoarces viviparus TaxID=48416 RepID=A0AAW1FTU3_ZOAVI
MAAGNYKVPPPFDEKKSYESWKNEVEIWRLVTDLEKKKQALAVALSLTGRAGDSALEIAAVDLNDDEGMNVLLTKLDAVFLKEETDRQYEAYTEFDRITRENGVSMVDYIVEFERRYNRIRSPTVYADSNSVVLAKEMTNVKAKNLNCNIETGSDPGSSQSVNAVGQLPQADYTARGNSVIWADKISGVTLDGDLNISVNTSRAGAGTAAATLPSSQEPGDEAMET